MGCVHPLTAYWRTASREGITFDAYKSQTKVPFKLPCGQCIGCRLERARQWGVRCLHEKKMWKHNCYVTLTYNDFSLPDGGTLVKRDVQLFMKKLRKVKPPPVRFFLGGEYGEDNKRPHYHCLLFNCCFRDMVLHSKNKRGEDLYTSKELEELWGLGFCTIGEVTMESAVYCAKYALKKVNAIHDNSTQEHIDAYHARYVVYDGDGVCYDRIPEFALMSRRPGIGSMYYEKYGDEVRAHDSVIVDGRESRGTRFYDSRTKRDFGEVFDAVKKERKRASVLARHDNTPERLAVKEKLMLIGVEKKERKL